MTVRQNDASLQYEYTDAAKVRVQDATLQYENTDASYIRVLDILLMYEYLRYELPVQYISLTGLEVAWTTASETDHQFANDGNLFLYVHNASGSSLTVTIETPATVASFAIIEDAITVNAGTYQMIGPFDTTAFNHSDGCVHFTISATASISLAVVHK